MSSHDVWNTTKCTMSCTCLDEFRAQSKHIHGHEMLFTIFVLQYFCGSVPDHQLLQTHHVPTMKAWIDSEAFWSANPEGSSSLNRVLGWLKKAKSRMRREQVQVFDEELPWLSAGSSTNQLTIPDSRLIRATEYVHTCMHFESAGSAWIWGCFFSFASVSLLLTLALLKLLQSEPKTSKFSRVRTRANLSRKSSFWRFSIISAILTANWFPVAMVQYGFSCQVFQYMLKVRTISPFGTNPCLRLAFTAWIAFHGIFQSVMVVLFKLWGGFLAFVFEATQMVTRNETNEQECTHTKWFNCPSLERNLTMATGPFGIVTNWAKLFPSSWTQISTLCCSCPFQLVRQCSDQFLYFSYCISNLYFVR